MAFTIRKARAADAAGILQCLAEAFEPFRTRYTAEAFLDTVLTPETLAQRLQSMTILAAEAPSVGIVGTVACGLVDTGVGHLRGMAVRRDWQGAGVADSLLAAAEAELRARGCRLITLDTTAPLERAIRFYQKHGFRSSGRVQRFFGMPLFEYVKLLEG